MRGLVSGREYFLFHSYLNMIRRDVFVLILLFAALAAGLFNPGLLAQVPPAGTRIVNSAAATYYFEGHRYRVSSNEAEVYVSKIYGISITPDGSEASPGMIQELPPGATASFPYLLTNTGNTNDKYDLSTVLGTHTFTPGGVHIVWDKNGNGLPDPGEPTITQTPLLEMGESITLVVVYDVPTSAQAGQNAFVDLLGTSQGDATKHDTANVHEAIVTEDAAIRLTKSASPTEVAWGSVVTWHIVGKNIGALTAHGVTLVVDGAPMTGIFVADDIPAYADGNRYVVASLSGMHIGIPVWSEDGAVWTATEPADPDQVMAVGYLFSDMEPGQEFMLTYKMRATSRAGIITNIATATYDSGTGDIRHVEASGSAFILDPDPVIGPLKYPLGDAPSDSYISDSGLAMTRTNDLTNTPYVYVGETADFVNTIRNIGNVAQPINVSLDPSSNLPAGYTVTFSYYGGGPLSDTNGDGVVDVGTVLPGQDVNIMVNVHVPLYAQLGDNNGQHWNAVIRITGAADPQLSDTTTDRINEIRGYWRLSKEVDRETARYGDLLTYKLTFENMSDYPIENTKIRDRLDRGLQQPTFFSNGVINNENGPGSIDLAATYNQTDHSITWDVVSAGGMVPAGFKGILVVKARVVIEKSDLEHKLPVPMVRNFFSAIGDVTPPGGTTRHLFQVSNRVATIVGVQSFLRIEKSVDRDRVEYGDTVTYTLTLRNHHPDLPAQDLTVTDVLPPGLSYVDGTTTIDGDAYSDPTISSDGRTLVWTVSSIDASTARALRFHAAIAPDAPDIAINTGYVDGYYHTTDPETGEPYVLYSADGPATATIYIGGGFLGERTVLIGRVFDDRNANCYQDPGEPGISGARVLIEDGSFAITDSYGLYHLIGIRPGLHLVRLDEGSLPTGCRARDRSVTVRPLSGGPLVRADFPIDCGCAPAQEKQDTAIHQERQTDMAVPDFPATTSGEVIIFPLEGSVFVQRDKVSVMIETELSDVVDLYVNGELVTRANIGTRMYSANARRARYVYVSVPLRAGKNTIQIKGKNPKSGTFEVTRTVFLSGRPAAISFTYDSKSAIADGASILPVQIQVRDVLGNPALSGAFVTVDVKGAEIASNDANPYMAGWQGLIGPDGVNVDIGPVLTPGLISVTASSGDLSGSKEISFHPPARDWVFSGVGELSIGIPGATSGDWQAYLPAVQTSSLPFYSDAYWIDGHAALWGQGRIGSSSMLTFAVDSSYPILGPDDLPRYPHVWNDDAHVGRTANSSWRGFARLDAPNGTFAVLGDYSVDLSDPILYSFSRRFTGVQARFGNGDAISFELFAAETSQAWGKDEIPAADVCGPYRLSEAPIKNLSEQVWIETRSSSGKVIQITDSDRGKDYWIDYARGEVMFADAVPSQNVEGNANYIVVIYEVKARAYAKEDFAITGCILGPYTLSHVPLEPGSENVTVEHRDPATNATVSIDELASGVDYTIDYNNGKLMLTAVWCPTDGSGNNQVIHITYRTTEVTPRFPVVGGRVNGDVGPLSWDAGFVFQGTAGVLEPFSLFDTGIAYSTDTERITARFASNGLPDSDDIAIGINAGTSILPVWHVDASYRYFGAEFLKPDAASPTDNSLAGQGHTLSFTSKGDVGSFKHTTMITADFISGSWSGSIAGSYPVGPGKGTLGLDWDQSADPSLVIRSEYEATVLGGWGKVWGKREVGGDWGSFGLNFERGALSGKFSQVIDPSNDRTVVDYGITLDLGMGFSLNASQNHTNDAGALSSSMKWGIDSNFSVMDEITLSASFSGVHPDPGTTTYDVSISVEKQFPDPRDMLSLSSSFGSDAPSLKNIEFKAILRSPREWDSWGHVCVTGNSVLGRLDYVFRPIAWPWVAAIGQAELRGKDGNMSLSGSIEGIWYPWSSLELSAKWAMHTATHADESGSTATLVDLERVQALWQLGNTPWEVGGYLGAEHDFRSDKANRIFGIEIRRWLNNKVAVVAGINMQGLSSNAFPDNDYSYVGPFIRLEAKTEGGVPW